MLLLSDEESTVEGVGRLRARSSEAIALAFKRWKEILLVLYGVTKSLA